MYKKGVKGTNNFTANEYVDGVSKTLKPHIKKLLDQRTSSYVNSRELDDILCDQWKEDLTKIDGEHRWIEIHRSMRVRIIVKTLKSEFGYVVWSGKTQKIFYKPEKQSEFQRASALAR